MNTMNDIDEMEKDLPFESMHKITNEHLYKGIEFHKKILENHRNQINELNLPQEHDLGIKLGFQSALLVGIIDCFIDSIDYKDFSVYSIYRAIRKVEEKRGINLIDLIKYDDTRNNEGA